MSLITLQQAQLSFGHVAKRNKAVNTSTPMEGIQDPLEHEGLSDSRCEMLPLL